ncbi:hypothetical protein V5O48_010539 [Marasmius crinis-equi]|uniref:Uncharacterized protein n=1 Tax=Marasmius crinis-equi TaxID=585013 RepID=A0ABR3F839_9AGAR
MPAIRTTKSTRAKRRAKAWKDALKPWVVDPTYRVPGEIDNMDMTCTVSQAKTIYGLDKHDLDSLPHQIEENSTRKMYPLKEVEYLSLLKKQALESDGEDEEDEDGEFEPGSPRKAKTQRSTQSPKKKKVAEPLPDWQRHANFPQPPPKILKGPYKRILDVEMPDPEEIEWKLGKIKGPVSVSDACRLWVLNPEDLKDLSEKSPWIDQVSAAKRAFSLHGGFPGQRNLVNRVRKKEEARLDREGKDRSDFEWSPIVQEQLDWLDRGNESEIPRWRMPEHDEGPRTTNRVAVLYPIRKYQGKWLPPASSGGPYTLLRLALNRTKLELAGQPQRKGVMTSGDAVRTMPEESAGKPA